jgi:cytochrome c
MRRARIAIALGFAVLAATLLNSGAGASPQAPEKTGVALFERRCGGCHTLDQDRIGPRLRTTYGRKAASITGFPYSEGLKKAGITWDEATLDRWLENPARIAPDTEMALEMGNREERALIIAYLKSLAPGR